MYWFVLCVLFVLNSQMVLSALLSAKCAVCSAEFTGCAKCAVFTEFTGCARCAVCTEFTGCATCKCAVCTEFTGCAKCAVCTEFTGCAKCAVLCLVCRLLGYCGVYCAMRM